MVSIVIGTLIASQVARIIDTIMFPSLESQGINGYYLWIESPDKNFYKFPFHQALRIVRKQHWHLADVEPIKKIKRTEALRILVRGR